MRKEEVVSSYIFLHMYFRMYEFGVSCYMLEGRFEGRSIGCGVCVWRLALRNRRGGPSSYPESGDSVPCG